MRYGTLKQYIEKYNLKFEIIPIVKKSHICEVVANHLFDFDNETKLGYQIVVNNIHHRKNGEWQYFWFETTFVTEEELSDSTDISFEYRYSQINGKTDKSIWTEIAVENRINNEINGQEDSQKEDSQKEDTEKETAINVVKETINNDSVCGSSFYKVVFNDDLKDSLIIDEYSNNNDKESTLREIETRKGEITFIGYFEGDFEKVFFGNLPESSEDKKEVTLYEALKNQALYTYKEENGKVFVLTSYKGKQFKTDFDRFNQVLDKVELDISTQGITQNKPFK